VSNISHKFSTTEYDMQRSPDLLHAIINFCITSTSAWKLNLSAEEMFNSLDVETQDQWPVYLIEGHMLLLGDSGYADLESRSGTVTIRRITSSGYDYHQAIERTKALKDNPFMRSQ
jgi:hypothetical protein